MINGSFTSTASVFRHAHYGECGIKISVPSSGELSVGFQFLSSLTETELTEFGLDTLDEDYVNDMKSRRMCSVDVATWNDLVRSLVALDFSMADISQLRLLLASIVLLNAVRFLPASPSPSDAPVNIRVRLLSHASKDSLASNENCLATDVNGATAEIHPDDLEKGKPLSW